MAFLIQVNVRLTPSVPLQSMPQQIMSPKLPEAVSPPNFWEQIVCGIGLVWSMGVFLGIGVAADGTASGIVWALTLAALIALINSWSTVQQVALSDIDPLLTPIWLQFTADSTLFLAKLTFAATAALGLAGYLLNGLHPVDPIWLIPTGLVAIVGLTRIALHRQMSLKWSYLALTVVAAAVLSLIATGLLAVVQSNGRAVFSLATIIGSPLAIAPLLQATALMTVAYIGCETLGLGWNFRSVKPTWGVAAAISLTWLLYLGVALISINAVGASVLSSAIVAHAAPLTIVMQSLALPGGVPLIAMGGVIAMASMFLRLLSQLTHQLIDLNQALRRPSPVQSLETLLSPAAAVRWLSLVLSCILLIGDVKTLWAFSAFAFLIHSALIHWIAYRYALQFNPYIRWLSGIGGVICLFLAFWVDWSVWLVSLGLLALGLVWRGMMHWSDEQEQGDETGL